MSYKHIFVVADSESSIKELAGGASRSADAVSLVIFDEALKSAAATSGAQNVYLYQPAADVMAEDYAGMITTKAKDAGADLVMLSNSVRGRLLAGKIAAALETCVVSAVSGIEDNVTRRMVYGGAAFRKEKLTAATAVVTCGAGVFEAVTDACEGQVEVITDAPESKIKRLERKPKQEAVTNLAVAKKVVDVGRGFKEETDVEMCRELASALGAEVGCTRPVAENNGWLPKAVYIGVTGAIIKPDLVMTLASSGQVQHMVGINQAKTIVAINKDENAPIFKSCDFGVVGDVYDVLPKLISKLAS